MKTIKLFLLFILCFSIVKAQETFEYGMSAWQVINNLPGNTFIIGTNAGNGNTITGANSMYISWNSINYGASNSNGTITAYKKYENVCVSSSIHFDYRINGISPLTNESYYGLVVYSYDSVNWITVDTLRTGNCSLWYNKSVPLVLTPSTTYIGFQYVQVVDSLSICSPLAIDNVILMCDNTLPILLTNFNLFYHDCFLDIYFNTEAEVNTKYLLLQYSVDGILWADLYKFKGQGQSLRQTIYQKKNIPFFPLDIYSYFRMVEIDLLGQPHYYDIFVYSLQADCENNMNYFDILG